SLTASTPSVETHALFSPTGYTVTRMTIGSVTASAAAVPLPGAGAAGLAGLGVLAARRRRWTGRTRVPRRRGPPGGGTRRGGVGGGRRGERGRGGARRPAGPQRAAEAGVGRIVRVPVVFALRPPYCAPSRRTSVTRVLVSEKVAAEPGAMSKPSGRPLNERT